MMLRFWDPRLARSVEGCGLRSEAVDDNVAVEEVGNDGEAAPPAPRPTLRPLDEAED